MEIRRLHHQLIVILLAGIFTAIMSLLVWPLLPEGHQIPIICAIWLFVILRIVIKSDLKFIGVWWALTALSFLIF